MLSLTAMQRRDPEVNGPNSFEVRGLGNNLYLIQRKWRGKKEGYQGWQCLVRNDPTWVETRYFGGTAEAVLRQLRADGKIR